MSIKDIFLKIQFPFHLKKHNLNINDEMHENIIKKVKAYDAYNEKKYEKQREIFKNIQLSMYNDKKNYTNEEVDFIKQNNIENKLKELNDKIENDIKYYPDEKNIKYILKNIKNNKCYFKENYDYSIEFIIVFYSLFVNMFIPFMFNLIFIMPLLQRINFLHIDYHLFIFIFIIPSVILVLFTKLLMDKQILMEDDVKAIKAWIDSKEDYIELEKTTNSPKFTNFNSSFLFGFDNLEEKEKV